MYFSTSSRRIDGVICTEQDLQLRRQQVRADTLDRGVSVVADLPDPPTVPSPQPDRISPPPEYQRETIIDHVRQAIGSIDNVDLSRLTDGQLYELSLMLQDPNWRKAIFMEMVDVSHAQINAINASTKAAVFRNTAYRGLIGIKDRHDANSEYQPTVRAIEMVLTITERLTKAGSHGQRELRPATYFFGDIFSLDRRKPLHPDSLTRAFLNHQFAAFQERSTVTAEQLVHAARAICEYNQAYTMSAITDRPQREALGLVDCITEMRRLIARYQCNNSSYLPSDEMTRLQRSIQEYCTTIAAVQDQNRAR